MSWTPARRNARLVAVLTACALALGACGDDDEAGGGGDAPVTSTTPSTSTNAAATSLRVVVRANGQGSAARTRSIECERMGPAADTAVCRRLATVTPTTLAPVPGDVACPQIFGGPAVATVSGTLRGERVRASFDLANGCEIARWRDNAALLRPPPGNPPGP